MEQGPPAEPGWCLLEDSDRTPSTAVAPVGKPDMLTLCEAVRAFKTRL